MKFVPFILILMFLSGCKGNLSPESARQLLEQSIEFPSIVTCQWANDMEITGDNQGRMLGTQTGPGGDVFSVSPEEQDRCLETMTQAGFITERDGADFTLGGGAYFQDEGVVTVEFPCATAQLGDVTNVDMSGDKTTVAFTLERESDLPEAQSVIDDPNFSCVTVIRSTWSCEAIFTRDNGEWSLSEISGLGCPSSSRPQQ